MPKLANHLEVRQFVELMTYVQAERSVFTRSIAAMCLLRRSASLPKLALTFSPTSKYIILYLKFRNCFSIDDVHLPFKDFEFGRLVTNNGLTHY